MSDPQILTSYRELTIVLAVWGLFCMMIGFLCGFLCRKYSRDGKEGK